MRILADSIRVQLYAPQASRAVSPLLSHLDHPDVVRAVADCQCDFSSACACFILLDHFRQLRLLSRGNTATDDLGY